MLSASRGPSAGEYSFSGKSFPGRRPQGYNRVHTRFQPGFDRLAGPRLVNGLLPDFSPGNATNEAKRASIDAVTSREAEMSDLGVQPAAAAAPGLSQWQRISNTFTAPSKTFEDIKRGNLSWWLPFIIYVILGFAFYGVVNAKVGMRQVSENQIKLSPKAEDQMAQLTPEQREQRMNISTKVTQGIFLATPVLVLIMGAVISAVLLGTINFGFGGRAKFGNVFSVWMYAMLPSSIKTILGMVVLYAGTAPESFNIKNYAPTNIGAFLNPLDINPGLYSFLTSIDVITIWTLVLVGIGTALVAGVKRSSGYIAAFGWWALIVLGGAGIAAAFS
jgi:hypothetical protein